jgi:hypothetical protein
MSKAVSAFVAIINGADHSNGIGKIVGLCGGSRDLMLNELAVNIYWALQLKRRCVNAHSLSEISMRRLLAVFVIMVSAIAVSGCSTIADAKAAKGSGTVRIYDKPYDVVWEAVVETLKGTSLSIASESKGEGVILAQGSIGLFTWGENVAIYVEDVGGRVRTRVEIINKRVASMNITAYDWEGRLSQALDARLRQ